MTSKSSSTFPSELAEHEHESIVMGVPITRPEKALWPDGGDGEQSPSLILRATTRLLAPG